MKQFLLFIISLFSIALLIESCSKKDEASADNKKLILIQKHEWIQDSVNTISSSFNVMQPDNSSQAYTFKSDTMTVKLSASTLILNVSYEAPEKVYYWGLAETKKMDKYLIIANINDKNLVTKELDIEAGLTLIRYFHSQ